MKKQSSIIYLAFSLLVFSLTFSSAHEIYYDNHNHFNMISLSNYYSDNHYSSNNGYISYSPKIFSSTFSRDHNQVKQYRADEYAYAPYFSSSNYFPHSHIYNSHSQRIIFRY